MLGRSVPEWFGLSRDTQVPIRVRLRVWERFNRCCAICTRAIREGDKWICDHVLAIINGGENREANLQPLCVWCAGEKFKRDLDLKSDVYAVIKSHYAPDERSRWPPIPGSKRSRYRKRMDGTVVRR
jgi:hypothetical protein